MNRLKKCLLMLSLGAGIGVSFNAWALPNCDSCNFMYTQCQAGEASYCDQFVRYRCNYYSGYECAVF